MRCLLAFFLLFSVASAADQQTMAYTYDPPQTDYAIEYYGTSQVAEAVIPTGVAKGENSDTGTKWILRSRVMSLDNSWAETQSDNVDPVADTTDTVTFSWTHFFRAPTGQNVYAYEYYLWLNDKNWIDVKWDANANVFRILGSSTDANGNITTINATRTTNQVASALFFCDGVSAATLEQKQQLESDSYNSVINVGTLSEIDRQ